MVVKADGFTPQPEGFPNNGAMAHSMACVISTIPTFDYKTGAGLLAGEQVKRLQNSARDSQLGHGSDRPGPDLAKGSSARLPFPQANHAIIQAESIGVFYDQPHCSCLLCWQGTG